MSEVRKVTYSEAINIQLSCDECIYSVPTIYDEDDDRENLLVGVKCHRFPPQVFIDSNDNVCQAFPDAGNICGEYHGVTQ